MTRRARHLAWLLLAGCCPGGAAELAQTPPASTPQTPATQIPPAQMPPKQTRSAQTAPADADESGGEETAYIAPTTLDRIGRIMVPVYINQQGP